MSRVAPFRPPKGERVEPPLWTGNFFSIDDLWSLSAAQIKAAVTLDRLAAPDGSVRISSEKIAKLAGVARPRLYEAVAYLTARGMIEPRTKGDKTPGYVLLHTDRTTKSRIDIALERGEAKLRDGGIVWIKDESENAA